MKITRHKKMLKNAEVDQMRDTTVNQIIANVKSIKKFFKEKLNMNQVDARKLAQILDLPIIERSLENTSKILEKKVYGILIKSPKDYPLIYVEEQLSETQKEITILHEIGHYILHWGIDSKYISREKVEVAYRTDLDYSEDFTVETQANLFATHIMFDFENVDNFEANSLEEQMFIKLHNKYLNK